MTSPPGPRELTEALEAVRALARRTPLQSSTALDERVGGEVLVKAEQLQRTGSFKVRGACARIAKLSGAERSKGVIAASAGNHAQGVALAGARLGVGVTVVMPAFASLAKIEATRHYGARIELRGETFEEAQAHADELAEHTGAVLIHPFDDPHVVAGQGTVGLEICEDAPTIDRVVVPVGGGGLAAGVASAVKSMRPEVDVVGVRPAARPHTIADGAAVTQLGAYTSKIVHSMVDDIVEVGDEAVSEAILLHLERMKQVVEGAGALPLAALLSGTVPVSGTSVLVASGGNIDPGLLMAVIRHGLGEAGRYLFVRILLEDRPGQLLGILSLLSELLVNVVSVVHHRAGRLPVGKVEVELTLETRDRDHADEVVGALESAGYVSEI